MLKGISHLISPELLATLARMGHGDEIVLADAHFPGDSLNSRIIRADGLPIADLLDALLPLFELDTYAPSPLLMMEAVEGDCSDPEVELRYRTVVEKHVGTDAPSIRFADRFAFYDQSKKAFAVVMTGETAKYGNIILKKGITLL